MRLKVVYDNASTMQACLLRLIQKSSLVLLSDEHGLGTLRFCGLELQRLSGYSAEELKQLPANWLSIIHPDDKINIIKHRQTLVKRQLDETQQTYRIITKNNTIRIVRERACMDVNSKKQIEITCIITDITSDVTKQVEQHVVESEARYRSLFEHSPIGMLIIDIDESKKAIATNPKWVEFMKSDMDTIMNANMLEFSPDLQPDGQSSSIKLRGILNKYRITREATSFEWQFKDREDRPRDMQVKFYPITVDGKEQTIMFSNDITKLKEGERKLRKALKKAEESDNLKSAFMANFSHEIRTPLNSVTGFSEMLGLSDLDEEERKHFVELIKHNVNDLLVTIEEIIQISRIESGQLAFNHHNAKVIEVCKLAYHHNKHKAANKGIDFKFDISVSDLNALLYSDHEKLLLILNNLIGNAIKFTSKGSITFWYKVTEHEIEFVIKDTGKGIAEENKEIIFQSFRQLENPTTKEFAGLGLGLPITKGYVEALNGEIDFVSTIGEGTTFFFRLPLDHRLPTKLA